MHVIAALVSCVVDTTLLYRSTSQLHSPLPLLGIKLQFFLLEVIFIVLMIAAVPIRAHSTVVAVCVANLVLLAWFWYNYVRNVEVTSQGTLRFWIGNIEVDVPFDKVVSVRRVATAMPCSIFVTAQPYRGFLSNPTDGVAIVTTVPSTPFWLWPRSAGKPDRSCCFGLLSCPRLTVVFSPSGGGLAFIRDVENEMRNFSNGTHSGPRLPQMAIPKANNPGAWRDHTCQTTMTYCPPQQHGIISHIFSCCCSVSTDIFLFLLLLFTDYLDV